MNAPEAAGWRNARMPAVQPRRDLAPGLHREQRTALLLLACGWKRAEIAERLGMSVRTVARRITEVGEIVGADVHGAADAHRLALALVAGVVTLDEIREAIERWPPPDT